MKTGKIARPPFIPKARTIAEKYRDKCYEEYVLPIFSKLLQAEIQRMKRLSYFEQEVNKTLAKAAKLIHFKESIKFYSCRGTFITRMIDVGIHFMVVTKISGNSPKTIYDIYGKNTNEKDLKKLMWANI